MNGTVAEYKKSIVFGRVTSRGVLRILRLNWVDSCLHKTWCENLYYDQNAYLNEISRLLVSRLMDIERRRHNGTEV